MGQTITKLLPPAQQTAAYPTGGMNFQAFMSWQEGNAQQQAFTVNTNAAADWLNEFNGTWLLNYAAGRYPYDANPDPPPVAKWATVTETALPGGGAGFESALVDDPAGSLVCSIPPFKRQPAPQTTPAVTGLVAAGTAPAGNPTIPVVPLFAQSTASDGTVWVRMS